MAGPLRLRRHWAWVSLDRYWRLLEAKLDLNASVGVWEGFLSLFFFFLFFGAAASVALAGHLFNW